MEGQDLSDLKRRLKKAVLVAEKLKKKLYMESEVSKELAKRNELLKTQLAGEQDNCRRLRDALQELDDKILSMGAYTKLINESESLAHLSDFSALLSSTILKSKRRQKMFKDESRRSFILPKSRAKRAPSLFISSDSESTSLFRRISDSEDFTNITDDISLSPKRRKSYGSIVSDDILSPLSVSDRVDLDDCGDTETAPLFEHFIVVGSASEVAYQVAHKILVTEDASLSNRLMKTLGGLLVSNTKPSMNTLPPKSRSSSIPDAVDTQNGESGFESESLSELSLESLSKRVNNVPLARVTSAIGSAISTSVSPSKYRIPIFNSSNDASNGDILSNETGAEITDNSDTLDENKLSSRSRNGSSVDAREIRQSPRPNTSTLSSLFSKTMFGRSSSTQSMQSTRTGIATFASEDSDLISHQTDQSVDNNSISEAEAEPTTPTKEKDKNLDFVLDSTGSATTPGTILFRYPPTVKPPPPEIIDFCLPVGGKLRRLPLKNDDSVVQEILYGHSQSKRTGRCFIFTLDDKMSIIDALDEEKGASGGRLYGICVINARLLRVSDNLRDGEIVNVHFESLVCYAFITRFPLFDFFFQVIFDILTSERLLRMEAIAKTTDSTGISSSSFNTDKNIYEYVPADTLNEILQRLSKIKPPMYGQDLLFQASPGVIPIQISRRAPPLDHPEHSANSAEWALPSLLSWLSPELIVWCLGLMLCETKIIIIGSDPGIVSCSVLGLLALLRPLEWVSPIIPLLPLKHLDFVESPVPIIAGLVMDISVTTFEDAVKLLALCNDAENDSLSAVLDLNHREIYLSNCHSDKVFELVLPGAEAIKDKMKEILSDHASPVNNTTKQSSKVFQGLGTASKRTRALYSVSQLQKDESREVQSLLATHLSAMLAMASDVKIKIKEEERILKMVENSKLTETDVLAKSSAMSPIEKGKSPEADIHFFASDDDDDETIDDSVISEDESSIARKKNANLELLRQFYQTEAQAAGQTNKPSLSSQIMGTFRQGMSNTPSSVTVSEIIGTIIGSGATNNTPDASFMKSSSLPAHTLASQAIVDGCILLSKVPFEGDNDKFLKRLVTTQMYSEYCDGVIEADGFAETDEMLLNMSNLNLLDAIEERPNEEALIKESLNYVNESTAAQDLAAKKRAQLSVDLDLTRTHSFSSRAGNVAVTVPIQLKQRTPVSTKPNESLSDEAPLSRSDS